jgi:hypothetical protein
MKAAANFWVTCIQTMVISSDPYEFSDLEALARDVNEGDCCGDVDVIYACALGPVEAAKGLLCQRSEPEFLYEIREFNENHDEYAETHYYLIPSLVLTVADQLAPGHTLASATSEYEVRTLLRELPPEAAGIITMLLNAPTDQKGVTQFESLLVVLNDIVSKKAD